MGHNNKTCEAKTRTQDLLLVNVEPEMTVLQEGESDKGNREK